METKQKLFAFKLASKNSAAKDNGIAKQEGKWQARSDKATAGCTFYIYDYKCDSYSSADGGAWC